MRNLPRAISLAMALLAIAAAVMVCSSRTAQAGDEWQPISPEDLALKDNPKSPGADAMILYRESSIDEDKSVVSEYFRIKIFTKAGAKYGDVEIPYAKGVTSIGNLRARTIRPDGSIVNFEGKPFDKMIVKEGGLKVMAKTFTLPDVEPGGIVEYQYREQRDVNRYVEQEWVIQGDLYLRYGRFSIKPYSGPGQLQLAVRRFGIPTEEKVEKQPNGLYALEVRDIPGLEIEDYMPPANAMRARVEFFYRGRGAPENETEDQYWKQTDQGWYEYIEKYIDKKSALEKDVANTVSPADSPEVKLRKIYARVQRIRNLSFEEEKSAKEEHQEKLKENINAEDVLKHGYGYNRGLNYVFLGLVRAAGFDADAVFIAPRNERQFAPKMQEASELSYEITWVNAGGKEYFLDPGSRFFPFGLLPWYASDAGGLRVKKDAGDFIVTPELPSTAAELIRHAEIDVNDEGEAAGKLIVDFAGRFGADRRTNENDKDDVGRRKDLEEEIKGWLPSDATFTVTNLSNWDDTAQPVRVEGTVKVPSFGTAAGKRMLVPQEIFRSRQANSFKSENRKNDLDFYYSYEELDDLHVHVPKSFKVETVPQSQRMNLGKALFEISATFKDGTVQVQRHLMIGAAFFARTDYPTFRDFFSKVKSDDEADVVLESAESAQN